MRVGNVFAASTLLVLASVHSVIEAQLEPSPHDGRWAVALICTDLKAENSLVKGYEYDFVATMSGGKLLGQYGASGSPSSLSLSGHVQEDGTLEIVAVGHTGKSEFSIGRVAQGTRYSYNMVGKLNQVSGQATRREGRPCVATFTKQ